MVNRREFFQWTASALPFLGGGEMGALCLPSTGLGAQSQESSSIPKTGSDIGTLFPFVYSQAVKTDFPLSFLGSHFKDMSIWKRQARRKLLELLHYAPAKCEPRPKVSRK